MSGCGSGGKELGGTAAPGLGRRTLLASAAAAAVAAPLASPAAPAQAAVPVEGTVARLLAVGAQDRDLDWIKNALRTAVALELSTIPPYLCGWWSVKDRSSEAARLIRRIVDDEMFHLGVVCNLLVAVGGRPQVSASAPVYPGPLPGGVRPEVTVCLSGLTPAFVHDVMMGIEAPESPLARAAGGPTLGSFYGNLLDAFRSVDPPLSADGQLAEPIGSDRLVPITDLDGVTAAIETVKEQGEGTDASPDDAFQDDHPAHYYAFAEIYHGRRLQQTGGTWGFTGEAVPFPDARPMAEVPAGGWPDPPAQVAQLLQQFDTTYHAVLAGLDSAWSGAGARGLNAAIHSMRGLESSALSLMETPIEGTAATYGPQFTPPPASAEGTPAT
jgi:hypothetical protein